MGRGCGRSRARRGFRATVRRCLRDEAATRYTARPQRAVKLNPFEEYIAGRLNAAADLVMTLEAAQRQGRLKEAMHRTINVHKLLVVDEIGYLPLGREQTNLFFQVVAKRYEKGAMILPSERDCQPITLSVQPLEALANNTASW